MAHWIAFFAVLLAGFFIEILRGRRFRRWLFVSFVAAVFLAGTVLADYYWQTYDTEVWSGTVSSVDHKEEWDEYHPETTTCTKDSSGEESCTTHEAYWEHHDAKNYIYTTDGGEIKVDNPYENGRSFDDDYPNSDAELAQFFPIGSPSASVHHYVNRVKASYSIFKNKDIDLDLYPDLPAYPDVVYGYTDIPRIVGDVPNKQAAEAYLNQANSLLNKQVDDPDNPGKTRSWKEVNLIFVNLGADKPREYGLALQDKWENGNKNDFIVSFSMDSGGRFQWVYAFSWSETDILKLEVQDLMMGMGPVTDFNDVIYPVAGKVADLFVRKQFADFNYLQIDPSGWAVAVIWVLEMGLILIHAWLAFRRKARVRAAAGGFFLGG
ncbi:hypothetical protein [Cohnella zeiphila]|uniref:Uncharacterized protein n=1 Tax=Cohnella zeiphila TaxID=2761120 RepID=A0A7X0VY23_9BACL|nr:hypothetical protein [Cohnella zeiphila]MBB6734556.1 hypothetical protein [Cohnella zeiphila]